MPMVNSQDMEVKVGRVVSGRRGEAKVEGMIIPTEGWTATVLMSWAMRMGAEGHSLTNRLIRGGGFVGTITVSLTATQHQI